VEPGPEPEPEPEPEAEGTDTQPVDKKQKAMSVKGSKQVAIESVEAGTDAASTPATTKKVSKRKNVAGSSSRVASASASPSVSADADADADADANADADAGAKRRKVRSDRAPLPIWLEAAGETQYSPAQMEKAKNEDMSKVKKKYRMSMCKYCALHNPEGHWGSMKLRKCETDIYVKHEKSYVHTLAAEMCRQGLAGAGK
jgi:hypothetical protein